VAHRGVHVQPLRCQRLARHDDADIDAAAKAMVDHR
jgi:hypothetical protein